jgi:hypothetical protein
MNIFTRDYNGIIARIIFPDENTLSSFLTKSSLGALSATTTPVKMSNGLYRSWFKINSTKILFMESTSSEANIKDFLPVVPDNKWLEGD